MTQTATPTARPALLPVLWTAPLAGVLAALVNTVLYLLTASAFEGLQAGPQGQPFTVGAVIGASLVGAIGAGVAWALVARFTRNPRRVYTILAVVVLLASFASPFSLPGASTTAIVVLEVMHLVVFGIVMALVPRRVR